MTVRAKFKCRSIEVTEGGCEVKLEPVVSGSKENESFYEYTPGGSILLTVVGREIADKFVPGREYFVDFSPAAIIQ